MTLHHTTPLTGATAGDLAWLAGQWLGKHGENIVEEHWSEPRGETMMGMFR
jgi:hypothetical protein